MDSILDRMVNKIRFADIDPKPSANIYMEEIFEPSVYQEILARLPADSSYQFIDHPDAILPDGTKTRKLIDLTEQTIKTFKTDDQAFWQEMKNVLVSERLQRAIVQKFNSSLSERFGKEWPELVTVPIFYRDLPGYRISEHTDAPFKIATMQFYFPKDESQIHLGTSFHERRGSEFHLLKTNPFKPNSAYAFARTDSSWHSVKQIGPNESQRDTLALTIYIKGHEYKSEQGYM